MKGGDWFRPFFKAYIFCNKGVVFRDGTFYYFYYINKNQSAQKAVEMIVSNY